MFVVLPLLPLLRNILDLNGAYSLLTEYSRMINIPLRLSSEVQIANILSFHFSVE